MAFLWIDANRIIAGCISHLSARAHAVPETYTSVAYKLTPRVDAACSLQVAQATFQDLGSLQYIAICIEFWHRISN